VQTIKERDKGINSEQETEEQENATGFLLLLSGTNLVATWWL
jgi:hypothetical protein